MSQAEHPEVFDIVSSESEGIRLIKDTIKYLGRTKHKRLIPFLIVSSAYKFIGYQLGKHYESLPDRMVKWCSSNKLYWQ